MCYKVNHIQPRSICGIILKNGGITMKVKKFFSVITMLAVLLSFSSTTFAAYEYDENIAPPAE